MKSNRRKFLKATSIASVGLAGIFSSAAVQAAPVAGNRKQRFNMCGFRAPKLETVRIGFIGLGNRGPGAVQRMSKIEGVDVRGLCDVRPERNQVALKVLDGTNQKPELFSGSEEAWKKMVDRADIDLIYICTPWHLHAPMAVYAMEQGKHVCIEVPAAKTVEECWQLVETSERTKKHCVILENCCYDFFELLTLNMSRQGLLGEIIHGEGAYNHDLLQANFRKGAYHDMWRLKENMRNGNLYPTHGLGPVAQVMNINRGDRMDYLVATSTNDFSMKPLAQELAAKDDFYKPYAAKNYRGNMNITTIRTVNGKTILLEHDVSTPNIYSRIFKISGTKGSVLKYPDPPRIAFGDEDWVNAEEFKKLEERYQPAIVKRVGELAKQVGGHGGMDFLMDWRIIDCLRNGLPMDMDVYDAATWSAVAPLSETSVAKRSASVDVPDFTGGSWKTNAPVDISLQEGGNTKVKL